LQCKRRNFTNDALNAENNVIREPLHKNQYAFKKWPMVGLQYVCSYEKFILEQENKNNSQKTK